MTSEPAFNVGDKISLVAGSDLVMIVTSAFRGTVNVTWNARNGSRIGTFPARILKYADGYQPVEGLSD